MARLSRLLRLGTLVFVATALACDGGSAATTSPDGGQAAQDPFDADARRFLASLGEGDYGDAIGRTASPLSAELTKAEFDALSEVVAGLGEIQRLEIKEKKPVQGGQYRRYMVQFEQGLVEYEVTMEYGAVIGFNLVGPGFENARNGVLADQFAEFKVYEFEWRLEDGTENPGGEVFATPRVDWQLLVGGLAAAEGQHRLRVSVMLLGEDGKALFKDPIGYDVSFPANEQGVPTGNVDGHLEAPGPGTYTVKIHLEDTVAGAGIDHEADFEVE